MPAVHVDATRFPSTERIHEWIADLAALGHRRTGTPEGRRSAEYIADSFRRSGLVDVTIETAPTPCPTVRDVAIQVQGHDYETSWANGTGRTHDLGRFASAVDAELIYLGPGWERDFDGKDIAGKIVVCDIEFLPMTTETIAARNSRTEIFDFDGTLEEPVNKFDIYSPNNWPYNYFMAQERGAVGFIGSLRDYMDCHYYNEDYTESGHSLGIDRMHIPAAWVSRTDGEHIAAAASEGQTAATLSLDVEYELLDALNVHGTLPGRSEQTILVHSHHDAVFAGAVQDASGVSEVLALAEYFGSMPSSDRPKRMMFAATDTHFTDYVGHDSFIEARHAAGDDIILDIAIEHVGKEVVLDDTGAAVETGRVEPRIVYVTDDTGLFPVVQDAFRRHDLDRSLFCPVEPMTPGDEPYVFRADEVISDAYPFAAAGIPVVSVVCGQMYLFHPSDTIDRIPIDQLRPVGLAFAEIAVVAAERL